MDIKYSILYIFNRLKKKKKGAQLKGNLARKHGVDSGLGAGAHWPLTSFTNPCEGTHCPVFYS